MPAVANINVSSTDTGSVAAISTNARIDYILRFSKQAVLVVDELSSNYSHIGSLFLGSLPNDHNAAFISASTKLNDIQIRCRIIEQLFCDVLFDPEQPLAVSILRLSKGNKQPLSIVVDHSQSLSFQLIHELCYLAEIGKKAKQIINVVMLGTPDAAAKIVAEKALFNKKLAIISADSGQLLTLDNKYFKKHSTSFFSRLQLSRGQKATLIILALAIIFVSSLLLLEQRDLFSFSALTNNAFVKNRELKTLSENHHMVINDKVVVAARSHLIAKEKTPHASVQDIYQILVNTTNKNRAYVIEQAKPSEIVGAIEAFYNNESPSVPTAPPTLVKSDQNGHYYLAAQRGYIIQFAGFIDDNVFANEKDEFSRVDYRSYRRLLNGQSFLVITSRIYPSKADALSAITLLPEKIKQREPWVKAISEIQTEIKIYNSAFNKAN